jgi:hypothetical protein
VELAVVVIVLLLAGGFITVVLQRGRGHANRIQCAMHLKQLGDALVGFDGQHKTLPASCIAPDYATWAVQIAAYLPQNHGVSLRTWDEGLSYYRQADDVRKSQVTVYFCPARRNPPQYSVGGDAPPQEIGQVNYVGALGDYGCPGADGALIVGDVLEKQGERILRWQARTSLKGLKRGTSYTILLGEKHVVEGGFGHGAQGDNSLYNGEYAASFARLIDADHPLASGPADTYRVNFGSWHSGICQFLLADTSVRPFTTSTSVVTIQKLVARDVPE